MSEHTPIPWSVHRIGADKPTDRQQVYIEGANHETVYDSRDSDVYRLSDADAQFIARAVNAHDDLLDVLRGHVELINQLEELGCLDDSTDGFDRIAEYRKQAMDAIAKAEG